MRTQPRSSSRSMTRTASRFAGLALLVSSLLASGCVAPTTAAPSGEDAPLSIVASFYPVYIDVLQLAKDVPGVSVTLLVPPSTGCLHDYALTSGDMKALTAADILVVNGGGMEGFLTQLATDFPGLTVVESSKGIDLVLDPTGATDPHIWTSPKSAAVQLSNIAAGLIAADPAHADLYAANASRYSAELDALDRRAATRLAPYRGTHVLAGHSSFLYFARDYGFDMIGLFGLDDGQTVGTLELSRMIDAAKALPGTLIVTDPQYPAIAGDTVVRETGLPTCVFDSVASGTLEGPAAMNDYLDRMDANLDRIIQALEAR
jgi:zinc transport system substrate-binding protein